MRKIKLIAFLLSVTSCLLLFSVGFATWYNVKFPTGVEEQEASFEAYDVLNISNEGMDIFGFSMFSFKTAVYSGNSLVNFEDSDMGVVTITYRVPAETLAATGNSFKVNASLGYDATTLSAVAKNDPDFKGLFGALVLNAENNGVSVSCSSSSGTVTEVTPTLVGATEIRSEYSFENVTPNAKNSKNETADYEFTITYTFTIKKANDNFKNNFGQYLNGTDVSGISGTRFTASAYVTDVS